MRRCAMPFSSCLDYNQPWALWHERDSAGECFQAVLDWFLTHLGTPIPSLPTFKHEIGFGLSRE